MRKINQIIIDNQVYVVRRTNNIAGLGPDPCSLCDLRKKCEIEYVQPCRLFHRGYHLAHFVKKTTINGRPMQAAITAEILRKRYVIFAPHWSWGTAFVLFRKDGAGFVHFNVSDNGDIPSISDLFVQEGCRRKGVGSELLRDAEELARLLGHGSVSLWADPGGWCRGWYHRLGYRETPEMDTTPSGDIWMIKDFTKPI